MENPAGEIDFEEWELLSDNDNSSINITHGTRILPTNVFVDVNYFICPKPSLSDKDFTPQVRFKKHEEDEFLGIRVRSPEGLIPCDGEELEDKFVDESGFEDGKGKREGESQEDEEKKEMEEDGKVCHEGGEKRGKNGWPGFLSRLWAAKVGALCSIAMAAATLCIFIIGSDGNKNDKVLQYNNPISKVQFQVHSDDKHSKLMLCVIVNGEDKGTDAQGY